MMRRVARIELDKYARDGALWRDSATMYYRASLLLLDNSDTAVWVPGATLGHQALETYLKACLISEGLTIFDPAKVKDLDPATNLSKDDCAWGHDLIVLGQRLESRRPNFSLSMPIDLYGPGSGFPDLTMREALEVFKPFFFEIRYPREIRQFVGIGQQHRYILDATVKVLKEILREHGL